MTQEVEWVNRGNTAIINGWYFHFHEMYALRSDWLPSRGHNRMELIVKFPDTNTLSWYGSEYEYGHTEEYKRASAGFTDHSSWRKGAQFYAFFTPPEDRYNKIVQEAYETYLFERAISSV